MKLFTTGNGNIRGLKTVKNGIVLADRQVFYCDTFPQKYNGKNPMLKVWVYNPTYMYWECEHMQNRVTRILWDAYKKLATKPQVVGNPKALMKCSVPKMSHGEVLGGRPKNSSITDYDCGAVGIRRTTESYYAHLGAYHTVL